MSKTWKQPWAADTPTMPLPDDFGIALTAYWDTPGPPAIYPLQWTPFYEPPTEGTGVPAQYALTMTEVRLDPVPQEAGTLTLEYERDR